MNTSRGRFLSELRRSNAAGIHASKPSRSALKQAAIKEEIDMAVVYGNFGGWVDPTDEDLLEIEIEEELFVDDDYYDEYDYNGYNASGYESDIW